MSEVLVIRLNPIAPRGLAQWLLVDTIGARIGAVLQGTLDEVSALAQTHRTVVLVPGAEVLHTELMLPTLKGGAKLSQIVPFALEEQLAGDVDTAHFAVGKRNAQGATPVDVVSHECMTAWLQALRAAGIQPNALYADSGVLPAGDEAVVVIEEGRVTARLPGRLPSTLDIAPLSEALQLQLHAVELQTSVVVYVSEDEYAVHQQSIDELREKWPSMDLQLLPHGVLPLLAIRASQATGAAINLLQTPYAVKTATQNRFKPWRVAAALLVGMLVLNLAAKGLELMQLKRSESAVDSQIAQTYSQAIPGAPITDAREARAQFEARLLTVAGGGSDNLMLGLNTLSEAVTQIPDTRLDALSYRNDNIDLRISAASVDALDKIRQQAQAKGLQAEIQSANPRDNRIEGRLQLKVAPQRRAALTSSSNGV